MGIKIGTVLLVFGLIVSNAFGEKQKDQPRTDGTAVLKECGLTLDLMVYNPRRIKSKQEAYGVGYCTGLVQGVYANASGSSFCPPDGVKIPHVLELVVSFVKAHPDLERKDAADIVRWALSDEYPCADKDGGGEGDTQASVRPTR
jgi:hypothetical protein